MRAIHEMQQRNKPLVAACLAALTLTLAAAAATTAPRVGQRDHLTPEEADLVRDAQELDKRTAIFVKAVERRFVAMNLGGAGANASKKQGKDDDDYGTLPASTRAQLLGDVARILDEASTNIDDASLRSEKSPLVPKALRRLAAACQKFLPQLAAVRESIADDEREWLERAAERAEEIIGAAGKLPAEEKKK